MLRRSCSRSRSRRQLQFRTSSFIRRLTQIVQPQLQLVTPFAPFASFGISFLLFYFLFFSSVFGGPIRFFVLVQGDQDRGPPAAAAATRVGSADCILGAHSSVPHYGPFLPPFFTKLEHKYNKTLTYTRTRTHTQASINCHCLLCGFKYLRSMFWRLLFALIKPKIFVLVFNYSVFYLHKLNAVRNAHTKGESLCRIFKMRISLNWKQTI